MAFEVRMPKLGMTMDDGVVTRWLKREGDSVRRGEPVAEISTEKIVSEIESTGSGILRKILVSEGEEATVGSLLALVGAPDEKLQMPAGEDAREAVGPAAAVVAASQPVVALAESNGAPLASPVARKLAKEHGIDLLLVKPAREGGRIGREEVLAYLSALGAGCEEAAGDAGAESQPPAAGTERALPISTSSSPGTVRSIPLVGMRKVIADHLVRSLHEAAQLSVGIEMDFTELVKSRESILPGFQLATGARPTFTDMLIVLVSRALQQHPILNSTTEGNAVLVHENVHMGVAVAVENGLIVPVIRDAQRKSLAEITQIRSDLARRATDNRLTPDEVVGGTFTITNPGVPGADISTPILNSPQNAILAVGRIVKKPAVYEDQLCIRQMSWICLTFDHRAMDGVPVAKFLDTINSMAQEPLRFLAGA